MGHAFYFDLEPRQKLLLLAIADHANDDGFGAYPGQGRLAEKAGCSERHVRRLLAILENSNLLQVVQQGDGRGHTTHYYLPWAEEVKRGTRRTSRPVKADTQMSTEPSLEPSSSSEPPRPSKKDSSSPSLTATSTVANFLGASKNQRVARLIDLGDTLGFPRQGGFVAKIIAEYGNDRQGLVDAAFAYPRNRGVGDPWEYVVGVMRGDQESQVRNRRFDTDRGAGDGGQSVAQGGSEILTEEEARRILAARADAGGGGGAGSEAQSED